MFEPPLYLITDRGRFPASAPAQEFATAEWRALEAAIPAGVGAVQLREKDLDGGALHARAVSLRELARRHGVKLFVNDRADVARASGADGVHLPERGLDVGDARRIVGTEAWIGRSVHGPEALAAAAGADFVVFGPVYATPSKRAYGLPQGLSRLEEICALSPVPVLAVGGITVDRVHEVLGRGAAGIAVIATVLDAADPAGRVRALVDAISRAGAR